MARAVYVMGWARLRRAGTGQGCDGPGWDGMCLAWLDWAVLRVAEWCCLCLKGHHTFPDIHTPLLGRHLDRANISANHHLRTFDVSTINIDKTDRLRWALKNVGERGPKS